MHPFQTISYFVASSPENNCSQPTTVSVSQQTSVAVGDLGHTLVLERLDELSQQLRDRDSHPLFIVSSVEYDNYLAKLQRRRSRRKQRKGKDVITTSSKDTRKSCSAKHGVIWKDSEGKQLLPPKPADRGTQSGEIDVLLHEQCGVILVEVSSCLLSPFSPVHAFT